MTKYCLWSTRLAIVSFAFLWPLSISTGLACADWGSLEGKAATGADSSRVRLVSVVLAVLLPVWLCPALNAAGRGGRAARLLLHAPLDGSADLAVAAGGQKAAELLPGAVFVPGRPMTSGQAVLAGEGRAAVRIPLDGNYVPERGTLMFWFQPQQHFGGTPHRGFELVNCGQNQGIRIPFVSAPHQAHLATHIFDKDGKPRFATKVYKYLLAKKWYHFAFTWDSSAGEVASWMYGHPEADPLPESFEPGPAPAQMLAGCSGAAIADLRIYDRPLEGHEIRALIPFAPQEAMAGEGKTFYRQWVDVDALRGRLVYENTFEDDASLSDWKMEGPGEARIVDKKLWLHTTITGPEKWNGHLVFWNTHDFPASFLAEWEFTPTKLGGLCIVFFCARGRQGQDIFDPALPAREGRFERYHSGAINCYHISYFRSGSVRDPICNMRKNHGFYIVDIGPDFIPLEPGHTNKITLIKDENHIMFLTNGRLSLDFVDDGKTYGPVWGSGKIGLRQMGRTWPCLYDNFRVYELK